MPAVGAEYYFFSCLSFLSPSLRKTARYRLKYCLKEPLNPEQALPFLHSFWSCLKKDTYVVFYLSCIIRRFNGEKTGKQMKSRQSFVRTADIVNAL